MRTINPSFLQSLFSLVVGLMLPYMILLPLLHVFRQKTIDGTLAFGIWHKVVTWLLVLCLLGFGIFAYANILIWHF